MFNNVGIHLKQLSEEKGINIDLLTEIIESTIILALRKKYEDSLNFHVVFDDNHNPTVYKGVLVVEEVNNSSKEISFEDAKKMDANISLGDEVWIIVDQIEEFGRIESQIAKTAFNQKLAELGRNLIYKEFKIRENQLVNGYYQREHKGNIYINLGETEGFLHKKDQSPREHYSQGDRIRAFIYSVENDRSGHPIIRLTRTKGDFIKKLFEIEIPEVADGTIEIKNVVRQPGLKTKVAVHSHKPEVDPVGACIGQKGVRIQSIIKEIEGEKIDIVKWSKDIREYIDESIAPAKTIRVIITDAEKRSAIVIVPDDQLALALGKNGYNIKLASHLTKYYIELKTESDIRDNPEILSNIISLNQIFNDEGPEELGSNEENDINIEENVQVVESNLFSLENIDKTVIQKLIDSGIDSIETLYHLTEVDILRKTALDADTVKNIINVLKESVEVVDEDADEDDYSEKEGEIIEEIEVYECPNCGTEINENMTQCPSCGINISFE